MKKLLLLVFAVSFYWGNAQSLISEKKILLTKDQRKNEPIGAFYESKSDGVLVYFESKKAKKEKDHLAKSLIQEFTSSEIEIIKSKIAPEENSEFHSLEIEIFN